MRKMMLGLSLVSLSACLDMAKNSVGAAAKSLAVNWGA
jgi:hypothetical protein